jgi:RNA polymerase sigma-70 factor, ECF subfamily
MRPNAKSRSVRFGRRCVLKIWEELTFAQIGEVLELSPHTAASRYQYAISKLTKRLLPEQREVRHG